MSLVRGMTTLNTRKRKAGKKTAKQLQAEQDHEAWLAKMGVGKVKLPTNKKGERVGIYSIPDYSTKRMTSDTIPAHSPARERVQYTGDEIMGITLNHKSNYEPVRRDNKKAAVDSAQMRRN
jgi:hypothetical protein